MEAHIEKQGYHIVREDPDMETRLDLPENRQGHRRWWLPRSPLSHGPAHSSGGGGRGKKSRRKR